VAPLADGEDLRRPSRPPASPLVAPPPKSGLAGLLRRCYGGLPHRPWLASSPNPAAPASSAAATAVPCTDFAAQACARPVFL
jgi:hypothetical protein